MPRSLDAALLTGWVRAATLALERHRAEMDRINVFPVPDGDTGTNLLLTMRSAAESLRRGFRDGKPVDPAADDLAADDLAADDLAADDLAADYPAADGSPAAAIPGPAAAGEAALAHAAPGGVVLADAAPREAAPADDTGSADGAAAVAAALARGALLGARGNSGVILSQVLRGVAEAIAAVGALGVAAVGAAAAAGVRGRAVPSGGAVLADALARAARLATAAVSKPREGTVLSVLASAARAARSAGSDHLDEVAVAAADAAAGAVRATTGQLPELARAGVVDAGGLGVYLVLDALAGLVSGRASGGLPLPGTDRAGPAAPIPDAAPVERSAPEYEVQYLLDAADPTGVDELRRRLDRLGESVTLADAGDTWSVHVHTDDVGAAIEAGLEVGRPYRIAVTRIAAPEQEPAPPSLDRHAVLLVLPGPELAELARAAGAAVLQREPGVPVGVEELTAALAGTGAREVVLLACDPELTGLAQQAAEAARQAGQGVLVVPSHSVLQGLAALAVHDPQRRPGDDIVAMAEAAAGTRTGALAVAEEEALTWAGRCQAGDVLGVVDGEIVLIAPDLAVGALWLARRMLVGGGELVTVLLGAGAAPELADGLAANLRRAHPEIDVIVHRGGRPDRPLELGVE